MLRWPSWSLMKKKLFPRRPKQLPDHSDTWEGSLPSSHTNLQRVNPIILLLFRCFHTHSTTTNYIFLLQIFCHSKFSSLTICSSTRILLLKFRRGIDTKSMYVQYIQGIQPNVPSHTTFIDFSARLPTSNQETKI